MDSKEPESLPPPPSVIPPDLVPVQSLVHVPETAKKISTPNRAPMSRRGFGSKGDRIQLLCNHFKADVSCDGGFYQYSVVLFHEDGSPVDAKGVGRKIIEKVQETYGSDLSKKDFAYDGEKSLFTVGPLPQNKMEFTVLLDNVSVVRKNNADGNHSPNETDNKRVKRTFHSRTFKVEITFATKIPMQAIKAAFRGQKSENYQEAIRVLDIILRQHATRQGCLLVRQSFFHNKASNFDLGGGVLGYRGFHSSFRVTQGGLSLNMDGSTTTIIRCGPLIDFLLANQCVRTPFELDWSKAKRVTKNLRIMVSPSNQEYKITGLSERSCKEQIFSMKSRGQGSGENETVEITVYDYFVNHRNIQLHYSGDLPCINVGKPKRPIYIPVELCSLLPLQRYTKALSVLQRSKLVESSRQNPQEKKRILTDVMKRSNYGSDPLLRSCGISISNRFTEVEGRVLQPPKMKLGDGDVMPRNGRWSLKDQKFFEPVVIDNWAVVNFSPQCDVDGLWKGLAGVGKMKGIFISEPKHFFQENHRFRQAPPPIRVEEMFEQMQKKFPDGPPRFILCILPERKNCVIYGPWKKKTLAQFGISNQCLSVPKRGGVNEQYLTNVLLKINAKLGGLNSVLANEQARTIPLVSEVPTIIFGMDVSHGSPGLSNAPSVAAVVSSRNWPYLSRYRASVRSQSPKVEMIDNLFKKTDEEDTGIVRELLMDFYHSSGGTRPQQIIIFRDGVSESQFHQVLNIELDQIIKACEFLDNNWSPKFTVIVAQKNHHTKFFQAKSSDNVRPGTVIDNGICHPRINDFYMYAHAGMPVRKNDEPKETTKPTHYHVLLDDIGFSPDDLQEFIHSLSYVYQKSSSAVSVVAPIRYAHLAASQISQFMKFDDMSETTSSHSHEGITSAGQNLVPELPKLHENVQSSMFFC